MSNPLIDIVPAPVRKIAYAVYASVGIIFGCIQVGISAAGGGQPVWLNVCLAIFAFLGGALGFTAASNTEPVKKPVP